jgi:hypothetical protein
MAELVQLREAVVTADEHSTAREHAPVDSGVAWHERTAVGIG